MHVVGIKRVRTQVNHIICPVGFESKKCEKIRKLDWYSVNVRYCIHRVNETWSGTVVEYKFIQIGHSNSKSSKLSVLAV